MLQGRHGRPCAKTYRRKAAAPHPAQAVLITTAAKKEARCSGLPFLLCSVFQGLEHVLVCRLRHLRHQRVVIVRAYSHAPVPYPKAAVVFTYAVPFGRHYCFYLAEAGLIGRNQ